MLVRASSHSFKLVVADADKDLNFQVNSPFGDEFGEWRHPFMSPWVYFNRISK